MFERERGHVAGVLVKDQCAGVCLRGFFRGVRQDGEFGLREADAVSLRLVTTTRRLTSPFWNAVRNLS